ncbi:MAG: PLxRFG domain-containing protein, partial [Lysobacter sp.]|nr:PLxRFG domain-containing protein [Lysobacter sp.]
MLVSKAVADPASVVEDIEAVMGASRTDAKLVERARSALTQLTPKGAAELVRSVKDATRPTWLGALTTRHLTELGTDYFANMRLYSDYLAEMGADRNQLAAEGEGTAEAARKWAGKNRAESQQLFRLMHDATIQGLDPAEGYQPLQFRYGGQLRDATKANVKEALTAIREQMRGRGGDNKPDLLNEAKQLRAMPAREQQRKRAYPSLVERWNQLSPEAQEHYRQMRDLYQKRSGQVEEALVARINDADVPDSHKRKIITTIRQQFESARLQGVYFPLQRFGRYFVAAERDGTPSFLMFERLDQLERAVKDLRARGFTIKAQGLKSDGKAKEAPSGTFVADVIQTLDKAGVSNVTQDQIYQLYLQALPELSMRKHSIHRQSVQGFDPDAVRAFAYNMHHGAHQLAKLRYAHKLQDVIDVLKKGQEAARREPDADTRRIAAGDAVLSELDRRHQWITNPQDSAATNLISSFGFVYYLGLTPAAALVNLTQTALVSYPYLASRFGAVKAMNALLAAGRQAGSTLGHIQKRLTDPDELRAHQVLQAMGALDKTQAHNLAGIAEGGMQGYNPAWARAMEVIGWGFHKTEVINREATGLAAYRLARAEGTGFDEAVRSAADTINDTHCDYTNANRARFMQSGTAKVLLMFRQYSLNMSWHLGRMVWNATKGEAPEVRKVARRNLAGILGMSALFSGVLGLPLMGVVMGALNSVASSLGDDDEPWDAETEFRAFLAGMIGETAADTLLGGAVNQVTGADIGSRVSLSQLWFRDADRELEGRGAYYNLLEQAAGPMGGVLKNALVGKQLIDDGHLMRGVETVLPKSLKDVLKAGRYATQGANNLRGDAMVEDLNPLQVLLQLNGFTPNELAERYDRNRSLKNYEQHILDRRQHLVGAFAMANRLGDDAGKRDVVEAIARFNVANPEVAITPASIRRSLLQRARYSAEAEGGIMLNRKLAPRLREAVGG